MGSILRDLSGDKTRLDLDHLEIFLARTAVRTAPVFVNVLPACAWRNPLLWPSLLFVVNQSTHDTHPGLVFQLLYPFSSIELLEITSYSTATKLKRNLFRDTAAVLLTGRLQKIDDP